MPKKNRTITSTKISTPRARTRVEWIDVFKGLAIMLVVAGHAASPANIYIYEFHMAAFLFIAGYTSKLDLVIDGWQLFIKKWQRLMWPYISFVFSYSLLFAVLRVFRVENIFFAGNQDIFFQPIWHFNAITSFNYTNPLAGVSWFLLLLFETSVIGYFGYQAAKKLRLPDWLIWCLSLVVFSFFAIKIWPRWPGTRINYLLDLVPICWLFFFTGFLTSKHQLLQKFDQTKTLLISVFVIWLFGKILPISNDYPPRLFSPFMFVVLAGLNGSLFLWSLSNLVTRSSVISKALQVLGQKSLVIFFCHFLCFKFVSAALVLAHIRPAAQLTQLTPGPNDPYWWVYWVVGLTLPLAIDKLLRKHATTQKLFLGES